MDKQKYCTLTFNGQTIDELVEGYTTINVEGRFLSSNVLNSTSTNADGEFLLSKRKAAKILTVHFLLKASSSKEFLSKTKKINEMIQSEGLVKVQFGDEEYYRMGVVGDISNPPYDSHQGVGSIQIYCPDPFAYSEIVQTTQEIKSQYPSFPVKIESIKTTISGAVSKLIIRNETRGSKIILNYDFKSEDSIEVTMETIKVNNVDKREILDFVSSDYLNFEIYSGDVITLSSNDPFTIEYREKVL